MNTNSTPLKRVLFLDDSAKFLEKIRTKMPEWSGARWEISTSSDTTEAFQILDTQHLDLIVVDDLRQSGMDGFQVLKLVHQKHPHIRKAMLSSTLDESLRENSLKSGADMYLVKPKRSNGFRAIFHSLDQLFSLSQEGFRGLLRKVSLTDLVQLECLNARSSVLEISTDARRGEIFIQHGRIIHAQAGSKTGVEAFVRLMQVPGGDFHIKAFREPLIRTIEISSDRLLLEASHAVDNNNQQSPNLENLQDANTSWFRKCSGPVSSPLFTDIPSSELNRDALIFNPATESATQHSHPTQCVAEYGAAGVTPAFHLNTSSLQAILSVTDSLIANRANMDMKILDMAILKEELNGCKSRLTETIILLKSPAGDSQHHINTLNEISDDTAGIVSQLDGFFAAYTEESSQFNEMTTQLQDEVATLHNTFSVH